MLRDPAGERQARTLVTVNVEGVDPRDVKWEVDFPAYRVYFWHQPPAPPGVAQEQVMFHCTEYRLSDVVDVAEVLDWVRVTVRGDHTYTLYVEQRDADGLGLVRLMGEDPTAGAGAQSQVELRAGETADG